jgi:hypothetical protein
LSVACRLISIRSYGAILEQKLTKSDIAVAHETCDVDRFVCSKAGNLTARQEVPGDTGISGIVADRKPTCTALARIVDGYPPNILVVSLKSSLDCQSIVVKDEDRVTLRIQ